MQHREFSSVRRHSFGSTNSRVSRLSIYEQQLNPGFAAEFAAAHSHREALSRQSSLAHSHYAAFSPTLSRQNSRQSLAQSHVSPTNAHLSRLSNQSQGAHSAQGLPEPMVLSHYGPSPLAQYSSAAASLRGLGVSPVAGVGAVSAMQRQGSAGSSLPPYDFRHADSLTVEADQRLSGHHRCTAPPPVSPPVVRRLSAGNAVPAPEQMSLPAAQDSQADSLLADPLLPSPHPQQAPPPPARMPRILGNRSGGVAAALQRRAFQMTIHWPRANEEGRSRRDRLLGRVLSDVREAGGLAGVPGSPSASGTAASLQRASRSAGSVERESAASMPPTPPPLRGALLAAVHTHVVCM